MTNYLKKDYNKDPYYNAGVIFIRIMLVFLILAAAAAVYRFSYKPYPLKSEGEQKITVTALEKDTSVTYTRHRRTHVYYRMKGFNEETGNKYRQGITLAEYKSLEEGKTYTRPVFKAKIGYFISWAGITDEKKAARVYYSRFPDSEIVICRMLIGTAFLLALVNMGIGIALIRRGNFNTKKTAAVNSAVSYEEILKAEHELERSK